MNTQYYLVREPVNKSKRKVLKPLLAHLDVELTERCNNACMHCYINLPQNDMNALHRELNTEQWKDIFHQAAGLGVLTVRFTGGEPLLRDDFPELYEYVRRLGMKVMLFTNARLITKELAELFVKIPPLKKIEISVYGMHPESYESVACKKGGYKEFKQGIDILVERQIPFIVKSISLPTNREDITEFIAWSATLPFMDSNANTTALLDLRARRDSPIKNIQIKNLRLKPEEIVDLLGQNQQSYKNAMVAFCKRFLRPQGNLLFNCGAGENGCVDAYGIYQMCIQLRHPDTLYNLSQGNLRDAHINIFPELRKIEATNQDYLRRCANCFIKGLCEQCPAKSWTEHGTLDTPVDYLCSVAHAQARMLDLLGKKEHAWEIDDWKERIFNLVQMTSHSS